MKKTRFTETQIVNILKLAAPEMKVEEICHQNGISNAIFYHWEFKLNLMQLIDIKKLNEMVVKAID